MYISSISQFNITGNNKSGYKNTMTKPIGLDTISFSGKNNTGKTQKKATELIFDGLDNETKEKILTKQDAQGRTLLMYALQTGNTKAADGLLNQAPYLAVRNTMVNARDKNGKTPLMYAAETGNTKAVEIILSQAANEREREDMLYAYEQTEEPEPEFPTIPEEPEVEPEPEFPTIPEEPEVEPEPELDPEPEFSEVEPGPEPVIEDERAFPLGNGLYLLSNGHIVHIVDSNGYEHTAVSVDLSELSEILKKKLLGID